MSKINKPRLGRGLSSLISVGDDIGPDTGSILPADSPLMEGRVAGEEWGQWRSTRGTYPVARLV